MKWTEASKIVVIVRNDLKDLTSQEWYDLRKVIWQKENLNCYPSYDTFNNGYVIYTRENMLKTASIEKIRDYIKFCQVEAALDGRE